MDLSPLRYTRFLGVALPSLLSPNLPAATLTVDLQTPAGAVSPRFSGLMTEEINHSYDGGLYAELLQNRSFRDNVTSPDHWKSYSDGHATVSIGLDASSPLNAQQPLGLRVDIAGATAGKPVGVSNDGYWGVPVYSETTYKVSFFARTTAGGPTTLTASLVSDDGLTTYGSVALSGLTQSWARYEGTFTTGKLTPTTAGRFRLGADSSGRFFLSVVSLFPPTWKDRPNGLRKDLMQMMIDLNPKFLRFPGGNYLEGNTIDTRFKWKETLGPIETRPGHAGPWGYRSTDGMGLLEFLLWCEDLKAEPVLAVYAGYSLGGAHVNAGSGLEPYVQEALDEIEYVTGDITTPWGARRAADGHPKPFDLQYVEVGNEDFFDKSLSYDGRFTQFFDAIKAKYPNLKVISTIGLDQVKTRKPDSVDEHYYRSTSEFIASANQFESYSRSGPEIFVGEWAAHEDASVRPWDAAAANLAPTPTMKAALGDAVWWVDMERNSDVVTMQCYAPLFVNVNPGARQWRPNLIGYNALTAYGSPSFYALSMFGRYLGDERLHFTPTGSNLQHSVTRNAKTGELFIKTVNTGTTSQEVQLTLTGGTVKSTGKAVVLSAGSDITNTLTDPTRVLPVETELTAASSTLSYTVPVNGIVVIRLTQNQPPAFTAVPESVTAAPGSPLTLSASATDADTYQWYRDDVALEGATSSTLTFTALSTLDKGRYTVRATNATGSTTSPVAVVTVAVPVNGDLTNLSVRSHAGSNSETLIAGFGLTGSGTKDLVLRGIGPTLSVFSVAGVVADPVLSLFSAQTLLDSNDNWGTNEALSDAFVNVGAFPLESTSLDAALQHSFAAGPYTVQVTPKDGVAGVGLVELYADPKLQTTCHLTNLSARTVAGVAENTLIAGFSVSGNVPKKLLLRGIGPELTTFLVSGALRDPQLALYDESKALVAHNDNWGTSALPEAETANLFTQAGAFPLPSGSRDAALVVTVVPGNYTIHLSSTDGSTGVGLVELYLLN